VTNLAELLKAPGASLEAEDDFDAVYRPPVFFDARQRISTPPPASSRLPPA